jgi:hypothetical protein
LFKNLATAFSTKTSTEQQLTMANEKPPPVPPPNLLTESKRPPDISTTETVILSPASSTTEPSNRLLIRLEFALRRIGKSPHDTTNNEPLPTLIKKALDPIFATNEDLEIHPIDDWPKHLTTVTSNVKTAPETVPHNNHNTEKTTNKNKKIPIITTPASLPTDRIGIDKYFQYTPDEHHPGEAKKVVVRLYITTSKTVADLKQDVTTDFLQQNNMWLTESRFDTLRESTIGWLHKVHPDATNRDHYSRQLQTFLTDHSTYSNSDDSDDEFTSATLNNKRSKPSSEASDDTPVKPTPTCPPFSILSKSTGFNLPTKDKKKGDYISTEVLQIRCATVDAVRLQDILADACFKQQFRDSFIPYSLKTSNPSGYAGYIKAQQKFLENTTAIKVDGFSTGGLDLEIDTDEGKTTLRSKIDGSGLFLRVDETITAFRSKGRALFVTDSERLARAEEFLDTNLPEWFGNLGWEQRDLLLLPGLEPYPTRVSKNRRQTSVVEVYNKLLSDQIPPTVEFENSTSALPPSNPNPWKRKAHNPVYFHDKPKSFSNTRSNPNKTTSTSDTSVAGESTNTTPTLATQLSQTEALVDSKLAIFKTELESSIESKIASTIDKVFAPLLKQLVIFSDLIAQSNVQNQAHAAQSMHTQMLPHSTAALPYYQQHDAISVHSQSPGRPLPPTEHHHPGHPSTYQQQQTYPPETHYGHAPPPHSNRLIDYDPDSNPDPDFLAQHQHPHQSYVDLSMADPNQSVINHTMTDPNQSAIDHTMTADASIELPSPPVAPKGILRNTSDQPKSGGASK